MLNLYVGKDDPGYLTSINIYLASQDIADAGVATYANDLVNHSVAKAREILHRYHIGCRVVSNGIHPHKAQGLLVRGRAEDDQNKDSTVAREIRKQIDADRKKAGLGDITEAVVVMFGALSDEMSGCVVETGQEPDSIYPYWFATVSLTSISLTTMLHEILHCANAQHYMAQPDLADDNYADPFDIMVVPHTKQQQDMRKNIGHASLALLKKAYFFDKGFTPKQNQSFARVGW